MELEKRIEQLKLEKEKITDVINKLKSQGLTEEDYSVKLDQLRSIEVSLHNSEEELRQQREMDLRKTIDWSKVDNVEINEAWFKTKSTYDSTKFNKNENNYKVVKNALMSSESDERGILLQGPTGTGKTTLVAHLGGVLNVPVISQNYSNGTEEQDVIGGFVPTVNEGTGDNIIIVKDGPLVTAMKHGLIYVAEEINFAKPGILAILNSVLDGNGTIITADNKIVKAHKNFKFVGTLNHGYRGTRTFNKSLVNRFGTIVVMEQPSSIQLSTMLNTKTGYGVDEGEVQNIVRITSLVKLITDEIKAKDYDAAVSVRQMISITRHLRRGMTFFNSVLYGAVNQISNYNADLSKMILKFAQGISENMSDDEIIKLSDQLLPSNLVKVLKEVE